MTSYELTQCFGRKSDIFPLGQSLLSPERDLRALEKAREEYDAVSARTWESDLGAGSQTTNSHSWENSGKLLNLLTQLP